MARTFGGLTVEELREIVARHKGLGWTHTAVNALPDLLAEIERLREALDKYGRHRGGCPMAMRPSHYDADGTPRNFLGGDISDRRCDCGLDAALEDR